MAAVAPPDTEQDLISRAQVAISHCNWEVGECAALWTRRFARGRTDGDFGQLVGLSSDQVYQRRRVWETFSDVYANYADLKWSHFYSSLNWDDAAECLQWAQDIGATVSEMKAWRRAQRGEDLSAPSDEEFFSALVDDPTLVRLPQPGEAKSAGGDSSRAPFDADSATQLAMPAASVARDVGESPEYAPFHDGAVTPPRSADASSRQAQEQPSTEQIVKRMTSALERCNSLMTDEFLQRFDSVGGKTRKRFLAAFAALRDKLDGLE